MGYDRLVIVAGAWTLFHLIWNLAQQTADDYWGIALLILFVLSLLLAFIQFFRERTALKVVASSEQFPEPAISRFFWLLQVRLYCGLWCACMWGRSGCWLAGKR
jgi:hypothetical protein